MDPLTTDVLIVGAGGAGMYAAITAAQTGASVLLVDKGQVGRGGATIMAQMTVAVALGEQEPDSVSLHLEDTLKAGRGLCNEELSALLCEDGPRRIREMERWGTRIAVLSLGSEGALALAAGERYRILAPRVTEVSDLGCGDSMVAGICWAASRGLPARDCLAWGVACGAANAAVWDPGGITFDEIERLLPQVEIRVV